jgi:hypothetical protein
VARVTKDWEKGVVKANYVTVGELRDMLAQFESYDKVSFVWYNRNNSKTHKLEIDHLRVSAIGPRVESEMDRIRNTKE